MKAEMGWAVDKRRRNTHVLGLLVSAGLILTSQNVVAQDAVPPADPAAAPAAPVEAPAATAPAAAPPEPASPVNPAQPAPAATDAPADGSQLPEVEVIQDAPQPPAPEPQQDATTTPPADPQPAVAQPAPQPAPPQQQAQQPPPQAAPANDGIEPLDEDFAPVQEVPPTPTVAQGRASGDLVPISPTGGVVISRDTYPNAVYTTSSEDFQRRGQGEPQQVLQQSVPGIIINDAAGSTYRSQIEFRGFSTGSLNGFPQGLAVYQNGVRINEVFGDTVFFDVLPSNAISDITVLTGNPVYGLNAVGGALNVLMKDGFSYQGTEVDLQGGSFARRKLGVQHGAQYDNVAAYFAYEKVLEDGYRDFSDVNIDRFYGDIGFKGSAVEFHANLTLAKSSAGVVAAAPIELLEIDRELTFTSPQTTDIEVVMPSINAKVDVTDTLTISGLGYYRRFNSSVIDGNLFDGEECADVAADEGVALPAALADAICSEGLDEDTGLLQPIRDGTGALIEDDDVDEPFGVIDRITQLAESFGGSLQAADKTRLFGMKNQFLVGVSYDQGSVRYKTSSELGTIGQSFVVDGSGIIIAEPDDFAGRDVDVETNYVGVYFYDNLEVTEQLALSVGGRYNYAHIDLQDLSGQFPGITSEHTFESFNPSVGATYKALPGMTLYASFSQANRAPTPGELACANPDNPCPIEGFLTDDPPLEQVKSDSFEGGIRGKMRSADGNQKFSYDISLFRTLSKDDILFVTTETLGRGFFLNAGDTLRQGVDVSFKYKTGPMALYGGYSYVRATFEDTNVFSAPSNPSADADGEITVRPGDRLPGIPLHRFKAGIEYDVTDRWTVGADLIAASSQFFLTDEGNDQPPLAGYTRVDVNSKYQLNDNVELYGFVNNVFDREYGLFGVFFENDEASEVVEGGGVAPLTEFNDPRSILPAPPIAAYAGVRVKF